MARTWETFRARYETYSADVPWGYKGECVSLVQRYVNECFDLPLKSRGNAKDYGYTLLRDKDAFEIKESELRLGDIIVWDGNVGGGFGHVAIALGNGNVLDQNRSSDSDNKKKAMERKPLSQKPIQYLRMNGELLRLKPEPKPQLKSNEDIAQEVKNGRWGNNPERKRKLTEAGYDYDAIQAIVNGKETKPTPTPKPEPKPQKPTPIKIGDTVNRIGNGNTNSYGSGSVVKTRGKGYVVEIYEGRAYPYQLSYVKGNKNGNKSLGFFDSKGLEKV